VKAFVTGATGFVGAHLVAALRARGHAVAALVRAPARAARLRWDDAVERVRGDLTDPAALAAGMAGADVVFHVAGTVSGHTAAAFFRVNRDGTGRVLDAAAATGASRLVFVSTLGVAGPSPIGQPHESGDETGPVTDYARSKRAAEDLVRGSDLPWVIVRPPAVYGEWDPEFLRVFKLARLGIAPVFGAGTQELSFVHAGDLAEALIAAAERGVPGRTYYAAHPGIHTSREVAVTAGRAVGRTPRVLPVPGGLARGLLGAIGSAARLAGRSTLLTADKANEFLAPAWTCSATVLTRDTGWQATLDLSSGFRRTVAWYRAQGWL